MMNRMDNFFNFCEQILVHRSYLPNETMNASPSALNSPNQLKSIDPNQQQDGLVKFEADKVSQKQVTKQRSLIVSWPPKNSKVLHSIEIQFAF